MTTETFFERFALFAENPDAVARLRELVLRLAVEGRLVAPLPEDDSVEDLLCRLAGAVSTSAKLETAAASEPFRVPTHWRWVRLGGVVKFTIGKTPARGDATYWHPAEYPWVSIADMKHYGIVAQTKEKVSAFAADDVFRMRFVEVGSLLMSFKLTIGKIARAGIDCFHNEAIISLKPPQPELLEYLFRSLPLFARLQTANNAIKGSTLNKELLSELPIALPPLAEQRRIVAKVDELMALCDRLEAQQQERETRRTALASASLARFADGPTPATLQLLFRRSYDIEPAALRTTILTLATQGRLVRQEEADGDAWTMLRNASAQREQNVSTKRARPIEVGQPVDNDKFAALPASWAIERLGNLVDPDNTISYGVLVPGGEVSDGVPFVRAQDLALTGHPDRPTKTIAREVERAYKRTRLVGGEILLCVVGSVGKLGVVPNKWAGANIARAVARIKPIPEIARDYLLLVLREESTQQFFLSSTRVLAQPTLNVGLIKRTTIPVPPLSEQLRIVAKVSALMAMADALEAQMTDLRQSGSKLLDAVIGELTAASCRDGVTA